MVSMRTSEHDSDTDTELSEPRRSTVSARKANVTSNLNGRIAIEMPS